MQEMPDSQSPKGSQSRSRWAVGLLFVLALGAIWYWRNNKAPSAVQWMRDADAAFARAEREDRPVLIRFSLNPCSPCDALDAEVFSDPEVGRRVAANFVPLSLDLAERPPLAARYGIIYAPTCVIARPDGRELLPPAGPPKSSRRKWFDQFTAAGLALYRQRSTPSRPTSPPNPQRMRRETHRTPLKGAARCSLP